MIQKTLGLSSDDVMKETWIGLNLKMGDMPWFDYNTEDEDDPISKETEGKKVIKVTSKEQADKILGKYKNKKK